MRKVTISNGPDWHRGITIPHAKKIIKEHSWKIEKAMAEHKRLHGWKVEEADDGTNRSGSPN